MTALPPDNPTAKLRELVRSAIEAERQLIELDHLCNPRQDPAPVYEELDEHLERLTSATPQQLLARLRIHSKRLEFALDLVTLVPPQGAQL